MAIFSDQKQDKGISKDSKFVRLVTGIPVTVQLLDDDSVSRFQHWLLTSDGRKLSVRCSGFLSCPVCARNASVGNDKENPKYIPASRRYLVNVVDLTPVKKSVNTGECFIATDGDTAFPERDSAGNSLEDVVVEPWGTVKVLEGGPKLFQKIQARIDLTKKVSTSYPMRITRIGEGRSTDYIVDALVGDPSTVNPMDFIDSLIDVRTDVGFNSEEIQAMLDGVTLKDILSARKALAPQININDIDEIPF